MELLFGSRHACEADFEAGLGPVLPKVLARLLEKTRASRIIVQRSWEGDPLLRDVVALIILGNGSVASRIKFSHVFAGRFDQYIAEMKRPADAWAALTEDLGFPAHRFDYSSRPFGRFTMFLPATIRLAQGILDERGPSSDAGKTMVATNE